MSASESLSGIISSDCFFFVHIQIQALIWCPWSIQIFKNFVAVLLQPILHLNLTVHTFPRVSVSRNNAWRAWRLCWLLKCSHSYRFLLLKLFQTREHLCHWRTHDRICVPAYLRRSFNSRCLNIKSNKCTLQSNPLYSICDPHNLSHSKQYPHTRWTIVCFSFTQSVAIHASHLPTNKRSCWIFVALLK